MGSNWTIFGKWSLFWIIENTETGQRIMTEPMDGGKHLKILRSGRVV